MVASRRTVLTAGLAAALTGCVSTSSTSAGGPGPGSGTSSTPDGLPSASSSTQAPTESTSTLPAVTAWHPDRGDLSPLAKLTAVRRIEAAGNGKHTALQVIDAQYGGLLADSASVLVVTRSWRTSGAGSSATVVEGGHTDDVRLSRTPTGWRVTSVHPSSPGPPAKALTAAARRVLASHLITLPPAGAADVRSGQVHDSVLDAMLRLSATYRIDVSVVRSGHPLYVFGTTRLSDHPQGRAFDTWAIDGHPVVDPATPRSLVEGYMRAAASAGSYNVGGPYLLGSAPQWFSDATHHDHVHAGFVS